MVRLLGSEIPPTKAHDLEGRGFHTPPPHGRTTAVCVRCSVFDTKGAILILVLSKTVYWQAAMYTARKQRFERDQKVDHQDGRSNSSTSVRVACDARTKKSVILALSKATYWQAAVYRQRAHQNAYYH